MFFLMFNKASNLKKRRANLQKHLQELLHRCSDGDPVAVEAVIKNIDPSIKGNEQASKELEKMVQNFVETAIEQAFRTRQLAVLLPLCEGNNWTFTVDVGEDKRRFCDRILDVALTKSLSTVNLAGMRLVLQYSYWTPRLHHNFISIACRCNNIQVVEEILSDGRMCGPKDQKQWESAALESARNGRMNTLQAIVEGRALVDNGIGEGIIFIAACAKGQSTIVNILLQDPNVDVVKYGSDALHKAAASGCAEVVYKLLNDSSIDPAQDDWVALDAAAIGGHTQCVIYLLESLKKYFGGADDNHAEMIRARAVTAASQYPQALESMQAILAEGPCNLYNIGSAIILKVCVWDLAQPTVSAAHAEPLILHLTERCETPSNDIIKAVATGLAQWAIRSGNKNLLHLWLYDETLPIQGDDVLMEACKTAHLDVFELAIESKRITLNPAIIWENACMVKHHAILHHLMRSNLNSPSNSVMRTHALARACEQGNALVVRGLLRDANVSLFNDGEAIRVSKLSVMKALMRRQGIDPYDSRLLIEGFDPEEALHEVRSEMKQEAKNAMAVALSIINPLAADLQSRDVAIRISAMAFGDDILRSGLSSDDVFLRARQLLSKLIAY